MADINTEKLPVMYRAGQYLRRIPGAIADTTVGAVNATGANISDAASGVAEGIGNFGLALSGLPPLAIPFSAITVPTVPAPMVSAPVSTIKAPDPVAKAPVPVAKAPVPVAKAPDPVAKAPKIARTPASNASIAPALTAVPEAAEYTPKGIPAGMVQMIKGIDSYYTFPGIGQPKMYLTGGGELSELSQDQRNIIAEKKAEHELQADAAVEGARLHSDAAVKAAGLHAKATIEASKSPVPMIAPQNYVMDAFGQTHTIGGGTLGVYDRKEGGFIAIPETMQRPTAIVTPPPQPPQNHIAYLIAHPEYETQFDLMYGVGAAKRYGVGTTKRILGK